MARDLLPYAVLFTLLLIAIHVSYMAFRSREAELKQALRKTQIALQDAERALEEAAAYHAREIRRVKSSSVGVGEVEASSVKFRAAKLAFARLFHPDTVDGAASEREIRTAIFRQYWEELERIDRRY